MTVAWNNIKDTISLDIPNIFKFELNLREHNSLGVSLKYNQAVETAFRHLLSLMLKNCKTLLFDRIKVAVITAGYIVMTLDVILKVIFKVIRRSIFVFQRILEEQTILRMGMAWFVKRPLEVTWRNDISSV